MWLFAGMTLSMASRRPDVFLKAAQLLGIPPQRCIVFEDALFGIEAARRADMKVVAVATTNPLELLSHADRAVESLEEISVEELRSWFS